MFVEENFACKICVETRRLLISLAIISFFVNLRVRGTVCMAKTSWNQTTMRLHVRLFVSSFFRLASFVFIINLFWSFIFMVVNSFGRLFMQW